MTPAQLDHLHLIDAHLERLLGIAPKRTQGEWKINEGVEVHQLYTNEEESNTYIGAITGFSWGAISTDEGRTNATFIASCAGNAEAGWKATRAAIAGYLKASTDDSWGVSLVASEVLESILAAFPLELIQKP